MFLSVSDDTTWIPGSRPQSGEALLCPILHNVCSSWFFAPFLFPEKETFNIHVRNGGLVQSPGFPDSSYSPNVYLQWRLRADQGHRVRLDFHTLILEDDCQQDFIKIYDSLAPIEHRALTEWDQWALCQNLPVCPLISLRLFLCLYPSKLNIFGHLEPVIITVLIDLQITQWISPSHK